MEPSALPGVADTSAETRIALAHKRFPGAADVLVFLHGGITYPIMPH